MATSSISADVKAANCKLAEFLRRKEEEELILQNGRRKSKQAREERLPGGSSRWHLEPDWKAPTPMVDRPRTTAGGTSFHFSYTSISKKAVPTVGGEPVSGNFGKVRNVALDHSKYIERDGAAEHSRGAERADYIKRDGAPKRINSSALMSESIERKIAAVINETPTAEDAGLLGVADVAPEGIPSVFSNISNDPFERQEFWRAVERCEANPRSHQIILEPDVSPAWWRELETTDKLDPEFKHHALQVAGAYRQHMAQPVPEGEVRKAFQALPMRVTSEKAGRFIEQARRMAGYRDRAPPFEFKSGRGGRIQFRMVAELPQELTAEDRALIVQNFCDHLASLEDRRHPDGTEFKTGFMYTAVIHAPDAHNDSRNYHLHVVAYDRPCGYIPEQGQWDFEIPVVYRDPGSGKDRTHYPFRQNKIGEVTQGSNKTGKEKSGKGFIPGLRAKFAEINNTVLKARGVRRQLDSRKYKEMGIDRTPTQHLGTRAAALESIGVPTAVGQLNAIAIWSDAERAIRRQAVQAVKAYKSSQSELVDLAKGISATDPNHPSMAQFRRLMAERARLISDVAEDREAIMTFDHMEAKAKSRAIRTRQTCLQFLADIEAGRADRNTKAMRLVIQDRWKGAQNHINSIDNALAPHRRTLAAAARNIETRERRILEIDTLLQPLSSVLEKRLGIEVSAPALSEAKAPKAANNAATAHSVKIAPAATSGKALTTPSVDLKQAATSSPSTVPTETISEATRPWAKGDDFAGALDQPLEPPSIEGLPIVEPTIAPRQDAPTEQLKLQPGTPEGLVPLRPIETPHPVASEPEIIARDLDGLAVDAPASPPANGQTCDSPGTGEEAVSQPFVAQASEADGRTGDIKFRLAPSAAKRAGRAEHSADSTPPEPKTDSLKAADPTLLELPDQDPRTVLGTSKAAYADFDHLINRIMDERIPIAAEKLENGARRLTVSSLSVEEQSLLEDPRFALRASQRLDAVMEKHKLEVQRVIRWIGTSGQDSESLRLNNGIATLGTDVKQSVRTLFRHWGKHEDVRAAFRAEYERRIEIAKAEEEAMPKPAPEHVEQDKDVEERRKEAERIYPDPSQAFTPQVAEFTRLLRALAPDDQLRAAADKIHADPRAREDIHKHTAHLATAYRTHVEGPDQLFAQQRFRDTKER